MLFNLFKKKAAKPVAPISPPHEFKPGDVVLTKRGYGHTVGSLMESNIPKGSRQVVSEVYTVGGQTQITLDRWPIFSFRPESLDFVERGPAPVKASAYDFLLQGQALLRLNGRR
jgi:hypothetical protein